MKRIVLLLTFVALVTSHLQGQTFGSDTIIDANGSWIQYSNPKQKPSKILGFEPHKYNYLSPVTAMTRERKLDDFDFSTNLEVSYQISMKSHIVTVFEQHLYFAYTQRAFWAVFNKHNSSPFREFEHNPEFFIETSRWNILPDYGLNLYFLMGIEHNSNGQTLPRSRSWNRLYGQINLVNHNWDVRFKFWTRLKESVRRRIDQTQADDNPLILNYYGVYQNNINYKTDRGSQINIMQRYNFDSGLGAISVSYYHKLFFESFLIGITGFHGYGESLIDYDQKVTRFGLSLQINQ